MTAPEELRQFVKEGLARSGPRGCLETAMQEAGWARADIRGALTCYAELDFPVPVPRPQPYLSARDAFVYLLLFTSLYLSAFSLGRLLFELINQAFPDPMVTRPEQVVREVIRWSVSLLIVAGHFTKQRAFQVYHLVVRERQDNVDLPLVMSNSFGFGGTNGTLIFKKA